MRINESLMPLYLWPLYLWSPLNQRSLTFFHIRISVSSATPEAQSHAPYVMTQKRDPILQISHSMSGPGHSSMELCCSVMITPHSKYRTWPQAGLLYSLQHTAYSLQPLGYQCPRSHDSCHPSISPPHTRNSWLQLAIYKLLYATLSIHIYSAYVQYPSRPAHSW